MTTVILVLLCLAIAGRELYLASDKRLPRAQAELRELRGQVSELARRHDALKAVVDEATEPAGIPIPPQQSEDPPTEIVDRLDSITGRVERLEKQFNDLSGELAGLDLDREAQRALARSLDAVERDVVELHREMLDRLDREEGVVTGVLLSEEGEGETLLADAYERCAAEYGLRVRVRDQRAAQSTGTYRGTVYHLSGRRPEELAEDLLDHARGTDDSSALGALLTELAALRGGGVVQFGPFTAAGTPDALVCGVVPDGDAPPAPPRQLVDLIRALPTDRQSDLSWLRAAE
ncbi:hypothetical protein BZB76_5044 [Actinomadura pelletieri DSM 43383]|uniref:Uncharacterized protein n=1 Tax=Actinomadura pelletieri DSM 43383 TaxID=1120940 RepID=A0A495QJ93_9ACTN|nr:hypothetical protein [Actinomadura pelletieri]RKS72223.1 hypothetical protein BZB76_5044 [Actinomadura pelletieri DSM 43383]